ncbi:MAG: hypothetical protein U0263_12190 [Polyangiaceae bacterium]
MVSRSLVFTALLLLGCGGPSAPAATTPAPSATPPTPSATPPEPTPSATATPDASAGETKAPEPTPAEDTSGSPKERLMRAHFKETAQIHKAVIDGALENTVKPAQALGNMKGLGTVQKSWKPSLDALSAAASRFGQSPDLPAATAAIADIGRACGSCHKIAGGPKVDVGTPPAQDKSLSGQMKRHAWALERLWEGLYVPSDPAWKAGADALAGVSFPQEVLKKGGVHARSASTQFTSVAPTLGGKQKPEDRAKAYAQLLETCSACHMATRPK